MTEQETLDRANWLANWLKSDEGQAALIHQMRLSKQTIKALEEARKVTLEQMHEPFDI